MNRTVFQSLAMAGAAITVLTGCVTTQPEPLPEGMSAKIHIKAYIDGSDTIKVKGSQLWYVHHTYQLPGMWDGSYEPTYVNGAEWRPAWKGNVSEMLTSLNPPLPATPGLKVYLGKVSRWDRVWIQEQPGDQNDHTLSVLIDDDLPDGPRWYEFDIGW